MKYTIKVHKQGQPRELSSGKKGVSLCFGVSGNGFDLSQFSIEVIKRVISYCVIQPEDSALIRVVMLILYLP